MRKIRNFTKIILLIMLVGTFCIPLGVLAQGEEGDTGRFIPCGFDNDGDGIVSGKDEECNFDDLLYLVQNLLNWLVIISFPISVITFSWAGFILMTTAVVDKKSETKKNLGQGFIRLVCPFSWWLIRSTNRSP